MCSLDVLHNALEWWIFNYLKTYFFKLLLSKTYPLGNIVFSNTGYSKLLTDTEEGCKKSPSPGVCPAFRCFDNTIALLAVQYSSAIKSERPRAGRAGKARKRPRQLKLQWEKNTKKGCHCGQKTSKPYERLYQCQKKNKTLGFKYQGGILFTTNLW